jgi:hypothetical protein
VALIVAATLLAGGAERLAGATACPNRSVIGPSCESQSVGPARNSCKPMTLQEASDIVWSNVLDASLIDFSVCNVTGAN